MVGKIAVVHLLWTTQEYAQLPSQDLWFLHLGSLDVHLCWLFSITSYSLFSVGQKWSHDIIDI